MRLRYRHALFAGFLAVVGLLGLLSVFRAGATVTDAVIALLRDELRTELRLLRGELDGAEIPAPDSLVRVLAARTGHRVTLIDSTGTVRADSDVPRREIGLVQDHGDRPEVAAALEGEVATAERRSTTVGRRLVYGAAPLRLADGTVVLRLAVDRDVVARRLAGIRSTLLSTLAVGVLLALGVAYALSRAASAPLAALAEGARDMAGGDLDARVSRTTPFVEFDDLAAALNRLAEELAARLGELEGERDQMQALIDAMGEGVIALTDDARILRANDAARELLELPEPILYAPVGSLVRQPDLRGLLEEAVVRSFRAREVELGDRHLIVSARVLERGGSVVTFLDVTELRRLEQVRRDFVANASHELKTPLTSMRGFAETLLEDEPPPELRRQFLRSIRNNTVRLQRLVDDLLDLSRLESGGWVARREEVDAVELARQVWSELEERAEKKGLTFEIEGEGLAEADEQGLAQVLRNLLENSIQYTSEGGTIAVRVRSGPERVEIDVEDTGIGIPSSALPRIFERFYRADPARSREEGGTGLGLAIVKHVVEAMDGRVEARSTLGKGTTIRVSLPRSEGVE